MAVFSLTNARNFSITGGNFSVVHGDMDTYRFIEDAVIPDIPFPTDSPFFHERRQERKASSMQFRTSSCLTSESSDSPTASHLFLDTLSETLTPPPTPFIGFVQTSKTTALDRPVKLAAGGSLTSAVDLLDDNGRTSFQRHRGRKSIGPLLSLETDVPDFSNTLTELTPTWAINPAEQGTPTGLHATATKSPTTLSQIAALRILWQWRPKQKRKEAARMNGASSRPRCSV